MGLYGRRAGKDTVMFRIALFAYNWGITPNMITALGLIFGVASGALFAFRVLPSAFVLGFLSVFCDVLDGTLARKFRLETKVGLIFDSTADRLTECAVVLGAIASGIIQPWGIVAIIGSTALLALRALSYRRGVKSDYVLFGRFERLIFILTGLLSPVVLLSTVCFVIAGVFGLVSSAQIASSLRKRNSPNKELN
jgi:phosphatidylglycerophosphate synthase